MGTSCCTEEIDKYVPWVKTKVYKYQYVFVMGSGSRAHGPRASRAHAWNTPRFFCCRGGVSALPTAQVPSKATMYIDEASGFSVAGQHFVARTAKLSLNSEHLLDDFAHTPGHRPEWSRLLGPEAPPEDHRGGAARRGIRGSVEGHGALGRPARQEGMPRLLCDPCYLPTVTLTNCNCYL